MKHAISRFAALCGLFLCLCGLASCSPKVYDLRNATFDKKVFKEQYKKNKAEWDAAFAFMARTDLDTLSKGAYKLTDRTVAKVNTITTKTTNSFEAHRRVIDVFFVIKGAEKLGVSTLEDRRELKRPYNEKRDVELYKTSAAPRWIILRDGQAAFVFPSDAHSPNLDPFTPGRHETLKLSVIKIPFAD